MNGIERKIKEIKEQKIGNSTKKCLVVEGTDDVRSLELLLSKLNQNWNEAWVLAGADKKSNVIKILEMEPDWLGIVDRDEWDEEKITQLQGTMNNLIFLPRYCIENYLIVPDELWKALPEKQKLKIPGGQLELERLIISELDKWVQHGVLWSVINPLWEGLRSLGFKEALLNVDIATNHLEIRKVLSQWHDFLNPDEIWDRYQTKIIEVSTKSNSEKLKLHVHGKLFYQQVVNTVLNQLVGQKSADDRQFDIIRTLPAIDDLAPVVVCMGL